MGDRCKLDSATLPWAKSGAVQQTPIGVSNVVSVSIVDPTSSGDANARASSPYKNPLSKLSTYRRIVLLTEGFSKPFYAKTAMSLLRYRRDHVIGVYDATVNEKTAEQLFHVGEGVPVIASFDGLNADALILGTATVGGRMPDAWRPIILEALSRGIDVVSGNHEFLCDDVDFCKTAGEHDCDLIDVRRNEARFTSSGEPFRESCLRVHAVGQDCTLGKMVVSLEVQRELARRGQDAGFVATGQTGIMIAGDGLPVDCVVADFVNGSVEKLVRRHDHHDFLLIEGQGSLSHPSFSAVTMGLLHGCAPQALIYCYEIGRTTVKGLDSVPLRSHREMMDAYMACATLRQSTRFIGIAMNGRNVSPEQAETERERMRSEFGLPVCDVYRDGAGALADAAMNRRSEVVQ